MNAREFKRVAFAILGIILLFSVAGGLYSINLARQYGAERNRLVKFEQDLVQKTRLNTALETAFGYGGFIHNFKDFVLRHDVVNQRAAEEKFDDLNRTLKAYNDLPLSKIEGEAIETITATLGEYRVNLDRVSAYIAAGMSASEIDSLVRVEPMQTVAALQNLNTVWDASFEERFARLGNMMDMEQREIAIIQATIIGFLLLALGLFWWIVMYEKAWRRALREQHASDAKYKEIIDNSGDAIITIDAKGMIGTFNPTASKIFGYSEEEVLGKNVSMLLPKEERERLDRYIANSSIYENTVVNSLRGLKACRKDGSLFPIELNISPYHVEGNKKCFVGMLRDITEKKKAEERLLQSMKNAIDANAAKNLFIANMNHELRTPLNAIIGYSEIMRMEMFGKLPSGKYAEYAKDINLAGHHLLNIISDILDICSIEQGKLELNKQGFHLAEIVNESFKFITQQAERNGVAVRYDLAEFDIFLQLDAQRMKQVLLNILDNSVKFTRKGGEISMSCAQEDDEVVLSVDDTGVGVAEKDIETIFEPFHQAKESHLITKEGTGLGLPLSRTLVELHGGTMEFFSELGKGSRVVIRLPNTPQLSGIC